MSQLKVPGHPSHKQAYKINSGRKRALQLQDQRHLSQPVQAILALQQSVGNRVTRALLQRQEGEGSATVVGSAGREELAADTSSFTQGLAGEQESDETPSEEELTESLEEKAITAHRFESQHPNLAQMGIRPTDIKGKKQAVYIGNNVYKNEPPWASLPGAKADAEKMKGAMEGHDYKTLAHHEDKDSSEVSSIFGGAVNKAKEGDALLLYYAGHGVPKGMVGVGSDLIGSSASEEEGQEEDSEDRGIKFVPGKSVTLEGSEASESSESAEDQDYPVTDVANYSQVLSKLEAGVAKGVHSTLISDACHSGAAADLVRIKAVEKLAETENTKVEATTEEIKRLEDLKKQIPLGTGRTSEASRGLVLGTHGSARTETKSAAQEYWEGQVRPELTIAAAYLKEAGMEVTVPQKPSDYTNAGIEQPINMIINQLIDLGEQIKNESEEQTLSKAPG